MPYLVLDNFASGLDSRRHILNSRDGTLVELKNAHITRGGEIEKRKAFSNWKSLPAGTFGLETTQDNVFVFGSIPDPGMPSGVTYQRLQHPDGHAMTSIVSSTVYGGLPFVIAEYSDGKRFCFWDGAIVKDWFVGIATQAMSNLSGYAEHIRQNFSVPGFTCTRSGAELTITGPSKKPFTIRVEGTGTITASVTQVQESKQTEAAQPARAFFSVVSGTESPARCSRSLRLIDGNALPDITGIYVGGEEVLNLAPGSGLRWDTYSAPLANLGPRFAYSINMAITNGGSNTTFSRYTVRNVSGLDYGNIFIQADPGEGSDANGRVVHIEFDADPTGVGSLSELVGGITASPYNAGRFIGTFGTFSGGVFNGIESIESDGVPIVASYIPFKGGEGNTTMVAAGAINSYTSTSQYTATFTPNSPVVTTVFAPSGTGSSYNGKSLVVQTVGDLVATSESTFSLGIDAFAGQPQISKVTFGGTFSEGSKVSIFITPEGNVDPYVAGASRVAGLQPSTISTYKSKEFVSVGSTVYFSSLNDATKWGIYDLGTGFIDMSNNFGGREPITGFGVYQDKLAVFSRRNVQLWFMDPDPSQNQQLQVLANTGCVAPDSVVSMGALDVFYLADNGIRSLRAREGTDTAFANDIGSAIDSIVISKVKSLSEQQVYMSRAVVEPLDGRYWLSVGNTIYVLSYFPGAQITAWSTYEPGFQVDEMAAQGGTVFIRSGNYIYLYGGESGDEYDSSPVVVEVPYLDAKKPATYKRAKAVELTVEGEWKVYIGFDHTNASAKDLVATVNQPTFSLGQIPVIGIGTHFGMRFTNNSPSYCKMANFIVHYDELQPKHEAG